MITDPTTTTGPYSRVLDLRAAVGKEMMERERVMQSSEYQTWEQAVESCKKTLAAVAEKQNEMIATVPDSRESLAEAERKLFELMKREGRTELGKARMKFSESNTVNKSRLLERAGGDLDLILDLATFTLKGVKEFAKSSGNKSFLDCIETTRTPSGIAFENA